MKDYGIRKFVLTILFSSLFFSILGKVQIAPWELLITSHDDTIKTVPEWYNSPDFSDAQSKQIPDDLGRGDYMMIYRSSFDYSDSNDLSLQISPSDHPYRIYINNMKVLHYGITHNPTVASNYTSEMAFLSNDLLHQGTNQILMILFPRGERSAPPKITIDNYINNTRRDFWQTFLNYTFIAGHSVNCVMIFFLFLSFWISSYYQRKDHFYFAITSLLIGLGYVNIIFASPVHLEPPLWIIARTSFIYASVTLMIFTSIHANLEPQMRNVNRFFLIAATIFFVHILMMDNKYDIDRAFSTGLSLIIIPTLILTFSLALRKLFVSRSTTDIFVVLGIVVTFIAAFHDIYFFRNFKLPYFWATAYGYATLEIAIVFSLAKDLWGLFIENRAKAILLEEKNLELKQQKEQLEQVNNGKSRFLKNMAHEFKTPLQGMVTIAELLQNQEENRHTLKHIMSALNVQMQKHLYNIQNVMDLSILENEIPEIISRDFSLDHFIQILKMMFQNNERNLTNILTIKKNRNTPPYLHGDNEHISRIAVNLLTNMVSDLINTEIYCAINWLPQEKKLEIKMGNGTGSINRRTLEILELSPDENFFNDSDESAIDDLAVFVAAKLIPILSADLIIREKDGEIILRFPLDIVSQQTKSAPHLSNKILVAEDNPVNRMLICKILEKLGYEVVTAEDGREAVEKNREDNPSLIFMDVQMPEMDGIEATKAIRESHSDVVIIALTANANRSECLKAGMNDFLNKPAKMDELKNVIDHYLAS